MKLKIVRQFILLVVLTAVGFFVWQRVPYVKGYYNRWAKFSFCENQIGYSIGEIDPRFEKSEEEVVSDIKSAANIWNEIAKREIFVYDPEANLDINLVYDERQQTVSKISKKRAEIEKEKAKYEAELAVYEAEKARVEARLDELNEEIKYWNSKGGAPQDIYNTLMNEQGKVQREINKINETTKLVNNATDRINSDINFVNEKVNDFNKLLTTLPEEGLYIGGEEKIEIYIYDESGSFIHTVAHELGHALGLDHVEEEGAILYPISSPGSEIKPADIEAFKNFCVEQDRLELIKNDLKTVWQMVFSDLKNVIPLNT